MKNQIYYGDNLDVLRNNIASESVDLCYIDPPFNSKRDYNQIYNNIGQEDKAQAQAFVDTWTWDEMAEQGLKEIINNTGGVFTVQSIDLILGLEKILKKGMMFAYLVSMTLRIAEIYRVLKPTGTFYLHCDTTASHYLKLVCDGLFCPRGGDFKNEIAWQRINAKGNVQKKFGAVHDVIFIYVKKTGKETWNQQYRPLNPEYVEKSYRHIEEETGRRYRLSDITASMSRASKGQIYEWKGWKLSPSRCWVYAKETMEELEKQGRIVYSKTGYPNYKRYLDENLGEKIPDMWTDINIASGKEALGYPTQKPEKLLERIIQASSNEGDIVLDAFCGCGTTVAVAHRLKRTWIGIDITYQSISLILKRLEDAFTSDFKESVLDKDTAKPLEKIEINGLPRDFESAVALANKHDDRTRKQFEMWMVLTYSQNKAIINEQKGGDGGVDGVVYVPDRDEKGKVVNRKCLFSVKSSKALTPSMINELNGVVEKEGAACGVFLSLYPAKNLVKAAKEFGTYHNDLINKDFPKIQIVCVDDIFNGAVMNLPNAVEAVKTAKPKIREQKDLF